MLQEPGPLLYSKLWHGDINKSWEPSVGRCTTGQDDSVGWGVVAWVVWGPRLHECGGSLAWETPQQSNLSEQLAILSTDRDYCCVTSFHCSDCPGKEWHHPILFSWQSLVSSSPILTVIKLRPSAFRRITIFLLASCSNLIIMARAKGLHLVCQYSCRLFPHHIKQSSILVVAEAYWEGPLQAPVLVR